MYGYASGDYHGWIDVGDPKLQNTSMQLWSYYHDGAGSLAFS